MQSSRIRIGTRGSPLALRQANEVRDKLIAAHGLDADAIEIKVIATSGDAILDMPLRDVGGKGLFAKEIEEALLAGEIALAVHSLKDMETKLPDGLRLGCLLPREDVRDAFISLRANSLADLPVGAVVGTASLRRQAQIKRLRADLEVIPFRGNVQTRLRKLEAGEADATLLAYAGLSRLGLADRATALIETDDMLPAAGQGAIGIELREGDGATADLVAPLNDRATEIRVTAERAFLAALDGSCHTPIGGLAEITGDRLGLRGIVLAPDGTAWHETAREGAVSDAAEIGHEAGNELRARAGPHFFED